MATSHFQMFLQQATRFDPTAESVMTSDCLYGLYVSWCRINAYKPKTDQAFRTGMRRCGVDVANSQLHMTGSAATDYILCSYPDVA
ncbi:hypothetical protein JHV56_04900 [Arthrobacter sp. BHU FT2]|nr:hypothetical protein [Arthrobacter sp. BHU FT2]